jgi:hypothetical protein
LTYSIFDLGTLGGSTSDAYTVNNADWIAGSADTASHSHAFLWHYPSGTKQDLLSLAPNGNSAAHGMNQLDPPDVAGTAQVDMGLLGLQDHAFRYLAGDQMRDLGVLPGQTFSVGQAISDFAPKWVVGSSGHDGAPGDDPPQPHQAFLSDGTTMTGLPFHNGGNLSEAWVVDDSATPQVYGLTQTYTYAGCYGKNGQLYPNRHATQWADATSPPIDLGTLPGGHESHVYGRDSSSGDLVGDSSALASGQSSFDEGTACPNDPPHAFLRHVDGAGHVTWTRLDSAVGATVKQSRAYGLNSSGQAVGIWGTGLTGIFENQSAFIWDSVNGFRDLITLVAGQGWSKLVEANAINNGSWIVGTGVTAAHAQHAFLICPTSDPSCTAPPPGGGPPSNPPPLDAGTARALSTQAPAVAPMGTPGSGTDRSSSDGSLRQAVDAGESQPALVGSSEVPQTPGAARTDSTANVAAAATDWGGLSADGLGGPLG